MRSFLTANVGIKSRLKFVLSEKYYNRFYNKSIICICISYILLLTLFIFPPLNCLLSILLPITIGSEFCKLHISAYCVYFCALKFLVNVHRSSYDFSISVATN